MRISVVMLITNTPHTSPLLRYASSGIVENIRMPIAVVAAAAAAAAAGEKKRLHVKPAAAHTGITVTGRQARDVRF